MRYPSDGDIDDVGDVLREMRKSGVDSETVGRLQSVVTEFVNAGRLLSLTREFVTFPQNVTVKKILKIGRYLATISTKVAA